MNTSRRNSTVMSPNRQVADNAYTWPMRLNLSHRAQFARLIVPINQALIAQDLPPINESILTERAVLLGLSKPSTRSANGSCWLLRAKDSFVAINLARPQDWEFVPALLGREITGTPLNVLRSTIRSRLAMELVERGITLGLPIAAVGEAINTALVTETPCGPKCTASLKPLVVNLASLWAGPLCAHLLSRLGARVIKVESVHRPDGTRQGNRAFFDVLHANQEMIAVDFDDLADIARLRSLLSHADVIIEGSRPGALVRRGIIAREVVRSGTGKVWASITGYGRTGGGDRVGLGDDTAVAGGLVSWAESGRPHHFIGDAIADPLTGLAATASVLRARTRGGGVELDLPLTGAASFVAGAPALPRSGRDSDWEQVSAVSRRATKPASAVGIDTARIFREFA